jgi:hypothetical protein
VRWKPVFNMVATVSYAIAIVAYPFYFEECLKRLVAPNLTRSVDEVLFLLRLAFYPMYVAVVLLFLVVLGFMLESFFGLLED